MNDMKIDMLLGGDLGLWALQHVDVSHINAVYSPHQPIQQLAIQLGVPLHIQSINDINTYSVPIAFSVHYPLIIRPHRLSIYRHIYNLHPGYLPWGRGYYPVFWALWESAPAGATLHEVTAGIDEGPIVDQIEVPVFTTDTGGTLFERVRAAERQLFTEYWGKLVRGDSLMTRSQVGKGSYHTKKEFFALKRPIEWESWSAGKLVKLARCLTFPGVTGLELMQHDHVFDVSLNLLTENEQ